MTEEYEKYMNVIYHIYGYVFFRWWRGLCVRASWWRWHQRCRSRLWSYPRPLASSPWRMFLLRWFDFSFRMDCPHCGYEGFDWYERPWFECTKSGTSYVPSEPTIHWFEGVQTCPRCRHAWHVAESD
jgi:hypothetical protein